MCVCVCVCIGEAITCFANVQFSILYLGCLIVLYIQGVLRSSNYFRPTFSLSGVPPSKRSEVWPLLAQRYQARNDPDWSMPPEVTGPAGLAQLLKGETEFEHNIVVDLGKTIFVFMYDSYYLL